MKSSLLLVALSMTVLCVAASGQESGRLDITVQRAATSGSLSGSVNGAKVIIVHWTDSGGHPSLVQDQTATTNPMGTCTVNLPPGTYDIFVAASELAPAAFRREIKASETTAVVAHLRPAPLHVQPTH